jgi:2-hydroxy-3-keto-5-methylthiopentenyl-1-phosphate phosphatase
MLISQGRNVRWPPREPRLVVLCDFDGTITPSDTTDGILSACAYEEWLEIEAKWKSEEISALECMEEQTICIRERQIARLDEYLRSIEIDPYFKDFVALCARRAVHLIVESDGYDYAIHSVLDRHNLGLMTASNRLVRLADDSFRLEFPYLSRGCAATIGTCKCEVARQACVRKWGRPLPLVVIGNDRTDWCVATRADHVFSRDLDHNAKGELTRFCVDRPIEHQAFTSFETVINRLAELLDKQPSLPDSEIRGR